MNGGAPRAPGATARLLSGDPGGWPQAVGQPRGHVRRAAAARMAGAGGIRLILRRMPACCACIMLASRRCAMPTPSPSATSTTSVIERAKQRAKSQHRSLEAELRDDPDPRAQAAVGRGVLPAGRRDPRADPGPHPARASAQRRPTGSTESERIARGDRRAVSARRRCQRHRSNGSAVEELMDEAAGCACWIGELGRPDFLPVELSEHRRKKVPRGHAACSMRLRCDQFPATPQRRCVSYPASRCSTPRSTWPS